MYVYIVNLKGKNNEKENTNSDNIEEMKIEVERKGDNDDKKDIIAKDEMILVNNDNNSERNEQVIFSSSDKTEVRNLVNVKDN
jgi:hypothetical protein